MNTPKISLLSAILMNINIMAGAGIFISIVTLSKMLGITSGLLYLIIGCFMFPLIFTFARLVQYYPSGGFYSFAAPISPMLGFISCWTYFFGKLASVTLYLGVIAKILQTVFPSVFAAIHPLIISLSILGLYIYLNCQNIKIGTFIQKCFATSKMIPLIGLILLGLYYFDLNALPELTALPEISSFIIAAPFVLYCFSGFEAACSMSRNIENPSVNAPKAIFYSFFSVIAIYISFQTLVSFMLQPNLAEISTYTQAYPYVMTLVPVSPWLQAKLATLVILLIGFSAMGAAYGILFSNSWNLYTLAQHKHTPWARTLSSLNKHAIPHFSVLAEGLICAVFLLVTKGNQIPLQQISTLGGTITYTISSIACIRNPATRGFLGYLSLLTCIGFIAACTKSLVEYDLVNLYLFGCMFCLGIAMYWASLKK